MSRINYMEVVDGTQNFYDLKKFCGDEISITYEIAQGIGGYFDIELNDSLADKKVVVPNGDYIVKYFNEETNKFCYTVVSKNDLKNIISF